MNEGIIPDNPIGELAFQMALAPWKHVDWHDDDLKNRFGASGESPRRSLLAWLECALEAEEPATKSEIHTDRHESTPGQGIFAKPAKSTIVITGDSWMTRSGQQLQFYSERPINALPTCRWEQVPPGKKSSHRVCLLQRAGGLILITTFATLG